MMRATSEHLNRSRPSRSPTEGRNSVSANKPSNKPYDGESVSTYLKPRRNLAAPEVSSATPRRGAVRERFDLFAVILFPRIQVGLIFHRQHDLPRQLAYENLHTQSVTLSQRKRPYSLSDTCCITKCDLMLFLTEKLLHSGKK